MLGSIVSPERSYVWAFTGNRVPASKNAMVRSPLSARVIFNVDDGDVNVLDITKNVVQEFERDFVDELEDVRHDPIEVTVFMEAGGEQRRNRQAPNLMSLDQLREESAQVRKTGKRARWKHDQGFMTMLCLDPRRIPVRPGNRPWRWTAILDGDQWRWCEKGCQGEVDGQVGRADAALVLDWVPDSRDYAEGFDLSIQEKRALLRSRINLGHPGRAEFVRILKGAGCRSDIIQYVQREFKCAGCDLEQRPPTRLPAATPRTYDFNVVIGIDVLFIHGVDNRTEHPILNITCLGTLYSTFGLIDPLRRSSKLTLKAFERLWLRTFGPPDYVLYDQGTEFTGGDFQNGLLKVLRTHHGRMVYVREGETFSRKSITRAARWCSPGTLMKSNFWCSNQPGHSRQLATAPGLPQRNVSSDDNLGWPWTSWGTTGITSFPPRRTKRGNELVNSERQLAKRFWSWTAKNGFNARAGQGQGGHWRTMCSRRGNRSLCGGRAAAGHLLKSDPVTSSSRMARQCGSPGVANCGSVVLPKSSRLDPWKLKDWRLFPETC